ncbi:MAG TPA: CAP domain-containing protein, partial [Gaiellaceae bacterium]|nr:CAP domain-containing protein [Gaiellaceae bacterium]
IARWYPSKNWSFWSVGENLVYAAPNLTAREAVKMWLNSPEHRANMLSRTWREIGISAIHFDGAPGAYDGQPVTIVTADFGLRR